MSMRFVRTSAMVLGLAAGLAATEASAQSQSSTNTMAVLAAVTKDCMVSTSTVAFGDYNVNATADLDKQGQVTVACTKGVAASISLDGGTNSNRRMNGPNGEKLTYTLFQNAGYSTPWDATSKVTYNSLSRAATQLTVYGRIPKNQDVSAGAYTDSVVATINF